MKCMLLFFFLPVVLSAQEAPFGNNPKAGHYASVNGIQLYYETYGQGKPLFLLHGNGGSIASFKNQIPFFSKNYQVIAIDSRLQGKSGGSQDTLSYQMMVQDFCALADQLKLNSIYVIGWSDGGIDAILMALLCPQKVKAIAFTGANTVPDSSAMSAADIADMRRTAADSRVAARVRTLNRMMVNDPNISSDSLSRITCPALVMAGDHDMIKLEHTLKIYQSIPHAQLCIVPGSGHNVPGQHADFFNSTIGKFFNSL